MAVRLKPPALAALALAAIFVAAHPLPAAADAKGCPPGLAKKAVPCVPPGQVGRDLRPGVLVTDYPYHLIRYPDRYGLAPLGPGERYYVAEGRILRVDETTFEVLDVIRAVAALLD